MTPRRVRTVGYLVWHLSTKWRIAVDRALKQFGLTHAHYLALGSLSEFSRGLRLEPHSREGRSILFSRVDSSVNDLMPAESFR